MNLEIGKQIRLLRNEKGVTQEELATHLGVSCQAVSKWENEVTTPDIQLLPMLSIYFGTTIDELFRLTEESHMERIDNMVENERHIEHETFLYAERFLKEAKDQARASLLQAKLYNHQANSYREAASICSRKALGLDAGSKACHNALIEAEQGICGDWHHNSHERLIRYYKDFVRNHPEHWSSHLYLIDQLLADGRCSEARGVLDKAKALKQSYVHAFYEGDIEMMEGSHERAIELWCEGVSMEHAAWQVYLSRAERMTRLERYDEALKDYEKAFALQEKPRYVDSLVAMALIYEILGQNENAIHTYERQISVLKEEHQILQGEIIDAPSREIERLKNGK